MGCTFKKSFFKVVLVYFSYLIHPSLEASGEVNDKVVTKGKNKTQKRLKMYFLLCNFNKR